MAKKEPTAAVAARCSGQDSGTAADTKGSPDSYLALVLGGAEVLIAELYRERLCVVDPEVEVLVASQSFWVHDTRGAKKCPFAPPDGCRCEDITIKEGGWGCNPHPCGNPVTSGQAGVGKLIINTRAPPAFVRKLPWAQALLALVWAPHVPLHQAQQSRTAVRPQAWNRDNIDAMAAVVATHACARDHAKGGGGMHVADDIKSSAAHTVAASDDITAIHPVHVTVKTHTVRDDDDGSGMNDPITTDDTHTRRESFSTHAASERGTHAVKAINSGWQQLLTSPVASVGLDALRSCLRAVPEANWVAAVGLWRRCLAECGTADLRERLARCYELSTQEFVEACKRGVVGARDGRRSGGGSSGGNGEDRDDDDDDDDDDGGGGAAAPGTEADHSGDGGGAVSRDHLVNHRRSDCEDTSLPRISGPTLPLSKRFTFRASCIRDGAHAFKSIDTYGDIANAFNEACGTAGWSVLMDKSDLEVVAIVLWDHVTIGISLAPADDGVDRTFRNGKVAQEGPVVAAGSHEGPAAEVGRPIAEAGQLPESEPEQSGGPAVDVNAARSVTDSTDDAPTSQKSIALSDPSGKDKGINAQDIGLPPGNVTLRPSNAAVLLSVADAAAACHRHGSSTVSHNQSSYSSNTAPAHSSPCAVAEPTQCRVVFDPCCGTGTVSAVAATRRWEGFSPSSSWSFGLGGEVEKTVATGYESSMSLGYSGHRRLGYADFYRGDACLCPLRDGVVDAVVTDLPFGLKCLRGRRGLERLYRDIVPEMARVLVRGSGVFVALTSQLGSQLLANALAKGPWERLESFPSPMPVNVGGLVCHLFVARRSRGDGPPAAPHAPAPPNKRQRRKKRAGPMQADMEREQHVDEDGTSADQTALLMVHQISKYS